MKLTRVEITNFRCFESLMVDLRPDLNVIVGANGAGKTTILDALAVALYEVVAANGGGGKRQRGQQKATLQPSDIRVEPGSADTTQGRKDFVQFRASATGFYPVDGFPATTPSGDPAALEWTEYIRFEPPDRFMYETRSSEHLSAVHQYFREVWQEIRKSASEALIPLPVVAYYRAHRRLGAVPDLGNVFDVAMERDAAFANTLDAGADFAAMCQWFYLRENAELRARVAAEGDKSVEFPDLRAVRKALAGTVEGVERVFFDGNPPRLKVAVRSSAGTLDVLELGQLSDGYRNLLAVVLDFARRLAQAHPAWPNPLEAPGVLLIDEIELHLHPRWQQTVVPSLQTVFPNTQLIVATHSPAVLTTVRREHVLLLGSDHTFEHLPADVGTYGAESSRVLAEVFGAHTRPPHLRPVADLRRYLELVEARQHESAEARALRESLERDLGPSDFDLQQALARIRQLENLGRRG
jgi:predicted ATP-binding protein involved in virulence